MERKRGDFRIERATERDIADIMRLEAAGFPEGIVEDESVFLARMRAFPEGFVLLRSSRGAAAGYLCSERWAAHPGLSADAFRLGHDPAERGDAGGSVLYLASMTIDPAFRSGGLGSQLFSRGRERIKADAGGIKTELLIVNEDWMGARKIYELAGFRVTGIFPDFFAPGGAPARAAILMERADKGD